MDIFVECHSSPQGEAIPIKIRMGDQCLEVKDVLDQWIGSENRYFKVKASDGACYILRQDTDLGYWELTFFRQNEEVNCVIGRSPKI